MPETKRTLTSVQIVLVHPSELFSEGLRRLLENTPYKLTWTASFETFDREFPYRECDLIFVVGGRPFEKISEVVPLIRRQMKSAHIIVLGGPFDPDEVMSAIEAGANGYLHEGTTVQALITAIEHVLHHGTVLPLDFVKLLPALGKASNKPDQCTQNLARSPANERGSAFSESRLSAREEVILRALVEGAPNKVIARRLLITEATVKVHVKAILRKIRVKNRTQAAIWAVKALDEHAPRQSHSNVIRLRDASAHG